MHGKTTPKSRLRFEYADESDKGPYPIPANVPIEGQPSTSNDGDRHALIVDRDSCKLYELYALQRTGSGWTAGSGAIFDLRSNKVRPAGWTSADAAGLPILPGLARWDGDASTGAIRHALRFTVERTRKAYVYPARHYASELDRSVAAADGPARAPQGERRHLAPAAPGADRRSGDEDLRDDPGRQRLELVRVGRTEPAAGRTTSYTRSVRCTGPTSKSSTPPACGRSVTVKVVPAAPLSTSTVPPIAVASCRTIARPSPLPISRSRPILS